jgi:hypothetical protein
MALTLIRLTSGLVPPDRAEWAKAMLGETYSLNRDSEALAWAIGCIAASISMRIESMMIGNLKISRWILAPEMALCFVPLTLVWYDGLFGMSGIIRLNPDIVHQYFLNSATGTIVLIMMFAAAMLGLAGPLGLLTAFRMIVQGRLPARTGLLTVIAAGPVLLGCIYITGWLLTATTLRFDYWAGLLLCSLLQALGAAHLWHLNPGSQGALLRR